MATRPVIASSAPAQPAATISPTSNYTRPLAIVHAPLAQVEFKSADYPSLQAMVSEFLTHTKMRVDVASFDVSGPVIDGHVKTTNLPWVMDESSLKAALKLKSVHLMNDLEAVARSVPVLRPADLIRLNQGH